MDPLSPEQIQDYRAQTPDWEVAADNKSISKTFKFDDFASALAFATDIGDIAQKEWHHPDLNVAWGKVVVTFSTHAIKGLSENDFIMAAKVDDLAK